LLLVAQLLTAARALQARAGGHGAVGCKLHMLRRVVPRRGLSSAVVLASVHGAPGSRRFFPALGMRLAAFARAAQPRARHRVLFCADAGAGFASAAQLLLAILSARTREIVRPYVLFHLLLSKPRICIGAVRRRSLLPPTPLVRFTRARERSLTRSLVVRRHVSQLSRCSV
jgi:hypothetical protein